MNRVLVGGKQFGAKHTLKYGKHLPRSCLQLNLIALSCSRRTSHLPVDHVIMKVDHVIKWIDHVIMGVDHVIIGAGCMGL